MSTFPEGFAKDWNKPKRCPNCGRDLDCSFDKCCQAYKGQSRQRAVKKTKFEPITRMCDDSPKYVLLPPKREPLPEPKPTPKTLLQHFNNLAGNTGDKV